MRKNLQIRDRGGRVVVEHLSKHRVDSSAVAMQLIEAGSRLRSSANNNINADSSRSHSVCALEIVRYAPSSSTSSTATRAVASSSTLWLVDLAGSERNERTGVAGVSRSSPRRTPSTRPSSRS